MLMPLWRTLPDLSDYGDTLEAMRTKVDDIANGGAEEIWLLQHPPLYTAGTSAKAQDLINPAFPVYDAERGGQYTYHGPGQRTIYTMLNLKARYAPHVPDVRHFVQTMECWIITTLAAHGIKGELREGRIGVWVRQGTSEAKIAAFGIRISKGISYHGIAINLNPDLTHYQGIIPCGIREFGVTSFQALGVKITMQELDETLRRTCPFLLDAA
jgi:lipoyl(octanoyl) transferase